MPAITFLFCIFLLYLSKNWLTREISNLVHKAGGDRNTVIIFWSILFLPGTVIHEMSHFLFAILTGARTGKIEVLPEFIQEEDDDGGVALGSVQTQRLNPLQGFLVGIAPFLTGIGILFWLSQEIYLKYQASNFLLLSLLLYLFFTVSNSFFPSWSDIRQTLPMVIISLVSIGVMFVVGVNLEARLSDNLVNSLNPISLIFAFSAGANLLVVMVTRLIRKVIFS